MANITRIFVEGDGDAKFVSDYISYIKPNLNIAKNKKEAYEIYDAGGKIATIQVSGGWTNVGNMKTKITEYKEANDIILLIFDADTNDNEGGYDRRKKELEDYALPLDEIFLFPNNEDDGTLENLLEDIILKTNKPIFDCWDEFEDCLQKNASKKIGKELTIPAKKSKIYVYLESLRGKTKEEKEKVKDPNRDYKEAEYWDLSSNHLESLKNFLDRYLNMENSNTKHLSGGS